MKKLTFYVVVAIFWLVVAGLALEFYARWEMSRSLERAEAWGQPRVAAAFAADVAIMEATAADAPKPPVEVRRDLGDRAAYRDASEEEREALARGRKEVVLVTDDAGVVTKTFGRGGDALLYRLAERFDAGAEVAGALGEPYTGDARNALSEALGGSIGYPRQYTFEIDGESYVAELSFEPWHEGGVVVYVRDSMWSVVWQRFAKNYYGENNIDHWPGGTLWTNSLGYRDDEVEMPKPEGRYRIVCIGGSTTVEGPRNDLTYPNMLERMLRESLPERDIEVVNCGVYTMDTSRALAQFDEYLALEPDLIVVYNFINDLAAFYPYMEEQDPPPLQWLRKSTFLSRYFPVRVMPLLSRAVHKWPIYRNFWEMSRRTNVPIMLCSFAYPTEVKKDPVYADFVQRKSQRLWGWSVAPLAYAEAADRFNDYIKQYSAERGFHYAPVAENVGGGLAEFTDICHMHLNAMEAKARVIHDTALPIIEAAGQ